MQPATETPPIDPRSTFARTTPHYRSFTFESSPMEPPTSAPTTMDPRAISRTTPHYRPVTFESSSMEPPTPAPMTMDPRSIFSRTTPHYRHFTFSVDGGNAYGLRAVDSDALKSGDTRQMETQPENPPLEFDIKTSNARCCSETLDPEDPLRIYDYADSRSSEDTPDPNTTKAGTPEPFTAAQNPPEPTTCNPTEPQNSRSSLEEDTPDPNTTKDIIPNISTEPANPTEPPTQELFELIPHPCTFPPPESATTKGIECTTRTFLVDVLPATYPYLPYRFSASPCAKFQIPFFLFTGPDPPPADIGTPGDMYVAPASSALYAYLAGGWTRWTPADPAPPARRATLKLGDAGLLPHPHFPAHLLWAGERAFAWYSLSSVLNARRDVRANAVVSPDAGPAEAAKVLVARTLRWAEEKKRRAEGGGETPRKRARVGVSRRAEPLPVVRVSTEPPPVVHVKAARGAKSVEAREVSSVSADPPPVVRVSAEPAVRVKAARVTKSVEASAASAAPEGWDAFYAKPRTSGVSATRASRQLQEQADTIARLEAENTALRARVEADSESTERTPAPERMAFHPEFREFMKETFVREVWRATLRPPIERIEAEGVAAKAKGQVAVLQLCLEADDDDAMEDTTPTVEGATDADDMEVGAAGKTRTKLAHTRKDLDAARAANTALEAEIDRRACAFLSPHFRPPSMLSHANLPAVKNAAMQDAASLHRGALYIADAQRRIAALEAEVGRLKQAAQHETEALRVLLAVRESAAAASSDPCAFSYVTRSSAFPRLADARLQDSGVRCIRKVCDNLRTCFLGKNRPSLARRGASEFLESWNLRGQSPCFVMRSN
ncbi:hypothetical protein DFH09DRAFT_1360925 [Mycena vulgaris]|nr:hypothetical protein DFH09DRAFT_1360925 [Mycena vulgaris]